MAREKIEHLNKAWLVRWGYHAASDEDAKLREHGIHHKIVDVLSVRKKFDKGIVELAQDIYRQTLLYPSEKVYLASYNKGDKRQREFFDGSIPCTTHYRSDLYRDLTRSMEDEGLHSEQTHKLREQWIKYPEYVVLGHNPYLEIRKVHNLVVYKDKNGTEVMEWDWPLPNGEVRHEEYRWV